MSSRFNLSRSGPEDAVEYETISSNASNAIERPERLHEWLSHKQIESLQRKFKTRPGETMGYADLREELENLNITFTDIEYNRLFLKINQNRDFRLDWNEFVSYLIFGFQDDEASTQKETLILPISTPPVVRKSEHRSPICSIALLKAIPDYIPEEEEASIAEKIAIPEDSPDATGMWLTASHEGQIRFWSPNLEFIRSSTSQSLHLKMATWILALQALSDVNIVCTSSTERELRFHETVASTFTLRIVIRSMPFAVCCMNYSFHPSGKVPSRLILGDYGGNVRILEFSPYLRGPFQSKPGAALIDVLWQDVLKGKLPAFKPKEYTNFHMEIVQSVYYSMRLNYLFAAAEYRNTRKYRGRCPGILVVANEQKIPFRIPLGVTAFYVDEKNHILVTGGPDTFIRIWDVYIPSEPSGILTGHNSGIVYVFVQPEERKIYSVDYQKIIKVWQMQERILLQTFGDIARLIPFEMDLSYFYHSHLRTLLIAGRKLISLKCSPRIRVDLTDGNTHAGPVSVVLYNRLFRNVVTCGLDSNIIVWDPWTGYRKIIMKSCHSKIAYGESYDIEITAATFDPLEQFLLTGARDGSLKIWNYNNAVCLRNMRIKDEHEVTAVIWVIERILAFGWDRQVTEFNDVEGREYSDPKKWPTFHSDDITCADVKLGEGVVTATYSGEIIFWKLETGQPYRRYNVSEPFMFIELKHNAVEEPAELPPQQQKSLNMNITRYVRKSISDNIRNLENAYRKKSSFTGKSFDLQTDSPRGSEASALPESVQAVLFLQNRPMTKFHGSVLVALDTGFIQVYSHHQRGGYLSKFNAIHKTGDCVLTMATDRKNRYLFTGTAFGYIKIWHILNYCIPEEDKQPICKPLLRLQFIFLSRDRFLTRAKRVVRYQTEPLLLSSYKAHLRAINSIAFIGLPKIIITGSHDHSVRLWSLGGRYLGTLGTPLEWQRLSPYEPVFEDRIFRLPPDIKKVASSTTMKVISGQTTDKQIAVTEKQNEERNTTEDMGEAGLYAKPLREPVLGKYFALPGRGALEQAIKLDTSQSYWPVYSHLKLHDTEELHCPPTPPVIDAVAKEEYMDYYMPPKPDEYAEIDDTTNKEDINDTSTGQYPEPKLQRLSKFTQPAPDYRKAKITMRKVIAAGKAPPAKSEKE